MSVEFTATIAGQRGVNGLRPAGSLQARS